MLSCAKRAAESILSSQENMDVLGIEKPIRIPSRRFAVIGRNRRTRAPVPD